MKFGGCDRIEPPWDWEGVVFVLWGIGADVGRGVLWLFVGGGGAG